MKSKIIYIASDEEDQDLKVDLLQTEHVEVLTAADEEEARQIVEEHSDIQLIIIGIIEVHKPEIMNNPPCDAIPKIVGRVGEASIKYKNATYTDIDSDSWLSKITEAVRLLPS